MYSFLGKSSIPYGFSPLQMPIFDDETINKLPVRFENPLNTPDVTLLVTSGCNVKCKYCYNYTKARINMSSELAIGFLRTYFYYQQIHNINYPMRQIMFTGGEPTLNPEAIFKVMEYINSTPYLCLPLILTNGIMSSQLLERLIEAKLSFQISYDGINNPLRQTLTGKAILSDKILSTIKRIAKTNLPIVLQATISEETVNAMEDIIRFAADNNIQKVIIAPMFRMGNALSYPVKQAKSIDFMDNFFKAYELAQTLNIKFSASEIMRYYNQGKFREYPKLVLLPDGAVSVTTRFLTSQEQNASQVIFGRYSIEDGLKVDDEKIKSIVNNFISNVGSFGCHTCEAFKYCRGRNMNISSFTSNMPGDSYPCEITKQLYQRLADKEFYARG